MFLVQYFTLVWLLIDFYLLGQLASQTLEYLECLECDFAAGCDLPTNSTLSSMLIGIIICQLGLAPLPSPLPALMGIPIATMVMYIDTTVQWNLSVVEGLV